LRGDGTWVTPTDTNIYSADGTLAGNRIVTQGANTLTFTSTATNGFSVDGTTLSVDAANNRVGIGSIAPTQALHVNGSAFFNNRVLIGSTDALGHLSNSNTNHLNSLAQGLDSNTINWVKTTGVGNAAQFTNESTDNFASGVSIKVLANNVSSAALDVSRGTSTFAGTPLFTVLSTGNVGVGKNTPTQALDVTGNVRFSGALMPNNLAGTSGNVLTSNGPGVAPTWTTPQQAIYLAKGRFRYGDVGGDLPNNDPLLTNTLNVTSVTRPSIGKSIITFTNPIPTTSIILLTLRGVASCTTVWVSNQTTTFFELTWQDYCSNHQNDTYIDFVVLP